MEDPATTAEAANGSGEKTEVVYDEKFYDLDDGWICDDDVILHEDGVDHFVNEADSNSMTGTATMMMDEDQRVQRREAKEMERMAKRFRVITPAEFEQNLKVIEESAGTERNTRNPTDSWGPSQLTNG